MQIESHIFRQGTSPRRFTFSPRSLLQVISSKISERELTSSVNMRQQTDSLSLNLSWLRDLKLEITWDNHWTMTYHIISRHTIGSIGSIGSIGHDMQDMHNMRQGTAIGRACVAFAYAAAPWIAAATVAIGRPGLRPSGARQNNRKHRAMMSYDI